MSSYFVYDTHWTRILESGGTTTEDRRDTESSSRPVSSHRRITHVVRFPGSSITGLLPPLNRLFMGFEGRGVTLLMSIQGLWYSRPTSRPTDSK